MSVVNNTASEIGDVILINSISPIFGIVQLQSYTDNVIGETVNRYFKKEFSYSIDGIFFTNWLELNNQNLLDVIVQPQNSFYINYRYTRQGSDINGLLEFVDIFLNGQFQATFCENYYVLPKSIFKDFFCNNPQHSLLCSVLTKKMWDKGIVPEYIIRNQTENPQVDDKDYLDFWSTTACFFALQLMLAKKLENFDSYPDLLQDFVKQRDLLFCKDDIELADLQYLKSNYYDEIRQRGTANIFEFKGFENKQVDGEFIRLICLDKNCDEFFWELITDEKSGWNLGNSSPMYKGTSFSNQLIKSKEKTPDFLTLNNYSVYNGGGNISLYMDGNKNVAKIDSVANGQIVGFSTNQTNLPDLSKSIIIDENVDYEITFWIKQTKKANNISFGVYMFDCDGNSLYPRNVINNFNSNFFFKEKSLNKENTYYFVRGILYNKNFKFVTSQQAKLNIGFGNNLKSRAGVAKIVPHIVLDRTNNPDATSQLLIWDFKVRPLVKGLVSNTLYNDLTYIPETDNVVSLGKFATCFLTTKNLLYTAFENNNGDLTYEEIHKIASEKLIPYNSNLITVKLTPANPPLSLAFDSFEFLLIKYRWFDSSGTDLINRTYLTGTSSVFVDNLSVGFQKGSINIVSGVETRVVGNYLEPYIQWGGTELNFVREQHVLVDFKKLKQDFNLSSSFNVNLNAFWNGIKNSGNTEIELITYEGGSMSFNGTTFLNSGGTQKKTLKVKKTITSKTSDFAPQTINNITGQNSGILVFNTSNNNAVFNL